MSLLTPRDTLVCMMRVTSFSWLEISLSVGKMVVTFVISTFSFSDRCLSNYSVSLDDQVLAWKPLSAVVSLLMALITSFMFVMDGFELNDVSPLLLKIYCDELFPVCPTSTTCWPLIENKLVGTPD